MIWQIFRWSLRDTISSSRSSRSRECVFSSLSYIFLLFESVFKSLRFRSSSHCRCLRVTFSHLIERMSRVILLRLSTCDESRRSHMKRFWSRYSRIILTLRCSQLIRLIWRDILDILVVLLQSHSFVDLFWTSLFRLSRTRSWRLTMNFALSDLTDMCRRLDEEVMNEKQRRH